VNDGGAARGSLELRGLTKSYGGLHAVDDVSLAVRPGEFVTLLGPSGSGKTTTLRIIAGFVAADGGAVILDGKDLTRVPPYKRDVGMVFQNYALFPHMSAAANVAFPLQMRRFPRTDIQRRVDDVLRQVRLEGLGDRYPRQLSGGQQQRVALARALVFNPSVLLMDEPLGALDRKLREALQLEIVRVCRRLVVTVIYVTHDQEEALVMSDRIAVYNQGRIEQVGTGETLYERPGTLFVADFVGESNIFFGTLRPGGEILVTDSGVAIRVSDAARQHALVDGPAALVVRPERMRVRTAPREVAPSAREAVSLAGRIREVIYLGASRKYVIEVEGGRTVTARPPDDPEEPRDSGPDVVVGWNVDDGVLVPADEASSTRAEGRTAPESVSADPVEAADATPTLRRGGSES
jgi:putative spermidine/putrescine transport system ATP-binding protein